MKNNKEQTLTQKTFSGFLWKFAERIGAQLVTTVVSIILARILMPDDYGIIAIVEIFIAFCNVFVTSGFGTALVQKKDADDLDFCSVFYAGLVVAFLMYGILFFTAPYIANAYGNALLCPVIRIMSLRLPIAHYNSVQHAKIERAMAFRKFFFVTLIGTVISAVVGIWMAYAGFGVWALVAQYMTNVCIDTVSLTIAIRWYPKLKFSFKRIMKLFSYGWKLLISGLLETGYNELRGLIIGIEYSSADLAYYTKAGRFPNLVVANVNSSISTVLFPAMAKVQDDKEKLKRAVRHSIRVNTFVIFPALIGLACVADAFIKVLLTDTWLPMRPLMQIICFSTMMLPLAVANLQAITALGRSDIYLKLEIIKKVIGLSCLVISLLIGGVINIALSGLVSSVLCLFINAYPNKKLIGYGYLDQIKDILPALLLSLAMGGIVYALGFLPLNCYALLPIQVVAGIIIYVTGAFIFKLDSFRFILATLKSFFAGRHARKAEAAAEQPGESDVNMDQTTGNETNAETANEQPGIAYPDANVNGTGPPE